MTCRVKSGHSTSAKVWKQSSVLVLATTSTDKEPVALLLACELVSELTGKAVKCGINRKELGLYEISFCPTIKGRHQLHIKVEGEHIKGSPSNVTAWSPVAMFDSPIHTVSDVMQPYGIAINKQGHLVVTELHNQSVSVYTPQRDRLLSFGKHGSGDGEFSYPQGVAVDRNSNILVADSNNHRIQKFTPKGEFVAAVGRHSDGLSHFYTPWGIAINSDTGTVYITSQHCVHILNSDLTFLNKFGNKGSGQGEFDSPQGVACDSTGNVYVADTGNHRIQVFTAEGKFLKKFGRRGAGKGELNGPCGIAIDCNDHLYITERISHRVTVLTSEAVFVKTFDNFLNLRGVAMKSGVLYVCDPGNNCIQLF